MKNKNYVFHLETMKKILKKAGADRISKNAAAMLCSIMEDKALGVAKKAVQNAMFAGRKSVKEEDVKAAGKEGT